jgi:hypothetical protein
MSVVVYILIGLAQKIRVAVNENRYYIHQEIEALATFSLEKKVLRKLAEMKIVNCKYDNYYITEN